MKTIISEIKIAMNGVTGRLDIAEEKTERLMTLNI